MIESQSEPAAFFYGTQFYLKNKWHTGYLDLGKADIYSEMNKISPSLQGKHGISGQW